MLDATLFKDTDIPLERIRLARATALLKLVQAAGKNGVVRVDARQRDAVVKLFDAERSFEVRNVLGEVKGVLGELEIQ